jgi:recombination protein RecR
MLSPSIQKLINIFSKFPTIGPRTAARFVFYLIETPQNKIEELIKSIRDLKEKIKTCSLCFNSFEPKNLESFEAQEKKEICPLCIDNGRDKTIVCIVAREMDLETIEKTQKYKGLYFVLNGTFPNISNKEKKEEMEQKVDALIERIKKSEPKIKEIILALNSTTEGESISLWLQRKFKTLFCNEDKEKESVKIVQLGQGLPLGGELEYADEETISSALENRK